MVKAVMMLGGRGISESVACAECAEICEECAKDCERIGDMQESYPSLRRELPADGGLNAARIAGGPMNFYNELPDLIALAMT